MVTIGFNLPPVDNITAGSFTILDIFNNIPITDLSIPLQKLCDNNKVAYTVGGGMNYAHQTFSSNIPCTATTKNQVYFQISIESLTTRNVELGDFKRNMKLESNGTIFSIYDVYHITEYNQSDAHYCAVLEVPGSCC